MFVIVFGFERMFDAFLDALDAHDGQKRHHLFFLYEWMFRVGLAEQH